MNRVRWGVLSTADIGLAKVLPAMQKSDIIDLAAISSRSLERAQAAAERLRIPKAYGSYDELLADPDIDAVYNPMPNHLHVPWSIRALEAGKHVLCEKPIGLDAAEGRRLLEAARAHPALKVMEAFMYRHHPQWQQARRIVRDGGVGELRTINSVFSYFNRDPSNVRNQADIGGGGLYDIGCYNISQSRFIFGLEPQRVVGIVEFDPDFGTDRLASAILDFGRGTATFTCSMQLSGYQRVDIFGTTGRVSLEIPFNAPQDGPCRLWHAQDGVTRELVFDRTDQYRLQGELMSRAILDDTPVPTPLEDAVANMEVIEAVFRSGREGGWVTL